MTAPQSSQQREILEASDPVVPPWVAKVREELDSGRTQAAEFQSKLFAPAHAQTGYNRAVFEAPQARRFEKQGWAHQLNLFRLQHCGQADWSPTDHLKFVKGLPMGCVVVTDQTAPPDERAPYCATELYPLRPVVLFGMDGRTLPGARLLTQAL